MVKQTLTGHRRPDLIGPLFAALRAYVPHRALALVVVATIAIRSLHFGSPEVDYDEPFYLLVGDRMLHGAIPYVDVWDRKPVGLFVLYAAIRLLGGAPFTTYLVVASLFVAATAGFIWALASRWVGRWAAVAPAITYVVWLEPFQGGGGQTASFYNLLVVAAVWLLVRARERDRRQVSLWHGLVAMALIGVALQIKYTVIPEGVFLALGTLWLLHRQAMHLVPLAGTAAVLALVALMPTLAAAAWYWHAGHLDAFVFANFLSAFQRGRLAHYFIIHNLRFMVIVASPLAVFCALGIPRMPAADRWFMFGWVFAALVGVVMLGNFYPCYFIPMLVPLMVCAAPNLIDRRWGAAVFALLLAWPYMLGQVDSPRNIAAGIVSVERMTGLIVPHIDARHCLYVFDGPTALYTTTHSCLPTRFVYPDHLTNDAERNALGADTGAEMKQILANRPGAIVTAVPRLAPDLNTANVALMEQTLARSYVPLSTMRLGHRAITVWALRDEQGRNPGNHNVQPVELYSQANVVKQLQQVHVIP